MDFLLAIYVDEMTLFHFANCVVLAYAPYVIAFKYSSLSDYTSAWKCVQAAAIYFLTQFLKLLLMATFFPDTAPASALAGSLDVGAAAPHEFHLVSECIKSSVDIIDIIGLHVAIGSIGTTGKGVTRALAAGLGWAAAHALATTLLHFVVEARTAGFQWSFVQAALGANLDFVFYMSLSTLVWTFQRTDLPAAARNFVGLLIVVSVFRDVINQVIAHYLQLHSWSRLGAEADSVAALFLVTVVAYGQIGQNGGNGANSGGAKQLKTN